MKSNVKPRNILKLLTVITVIGTTLGNSSSLNRNAYAFVNTPIDSTAEPIAPNSGITSQAETVMANATAQNLKNQTRQKLQDECTSVASEALNSRKLTKFLEKYLVEDEALKNQSSLDISKIKNIQIIDSSEQIVAGCCTCGNKVCCPCG